jgi:transposase
MAATARRTIPHVPVRYRCRSCGNLTRFDVVATRRTSAFHHYSVGGELTVEEEELLEERVERVTCRWCGASGDNIEQLAGDDAAAPAEPA